MTLSTKPSRDDVRDGLPRTYPGTEVIYRDRGAIVCSPVQHADAIEAWVLARGLKVTRKDDEVTFVRLYVFGFPRRARPSWR